MLTLLNDDVVETQLHVGALHNALFHRVLRHQAEDVHLLLLPDTMRTILQQQRQQLPLATSILKNFTVIDRAMYKTKLNSKRRSRLGELL